MNEHSSQNKKFQRHLFLNVNRHQHRILIPVFLTTSIASSITILFIVYIVTKITETKQIFGMDINIIEVGILWFLLLGLLLLLLLVYWTYHVSNRLVGPVGRILREMDEVLEGKKTSPIGTRKGDEMFEEILKRVNLLIKKIR